MKYTAVTYNLESDEADVNRRVFTDRIELENWLNERGISTHPYEESGELLLAEDGRAVMIFRGEPLKLEEKTTVRLERQTRKRRNVEEDDDS